MTTTDYKSRCYATYCNQTIRTGLLMCGTHWAMVTPETQRMVYATCREWKKGGSVKPYLEARHKANLEVISVIEEALQS